MSSSRRSIIKNTGRPSGPKKRLSFAPSPKKKNTEEQNNDDSQFDSALAPTDPSCKFTSLGFCYDPKATPRRMQTQHNTIPMKNTHRNNFTSVLNFATPSGTTVNVLIVGEEIFGENLKAYLQEMHHKQYTTQGLKWRMDLNITCKKTLTPAMTATAHFIIFLLMMAKNESLIHLSKILQSYSEDTLPSKRIIVVAVSPAQGCLKNVVDQDQFRMLLDSYQLNHFRWKEQGRLGQIEVQRIMELIYKSVGYHRGSSVLMDYIMQFNIVGL